MNLTQRSNSCQCGITEDGMAHVCERHYSAFSRYPMGKSLVTELSEGRKIWRRLHVEVLPPRESDDA